MTASAQSTRDRPPAPLLTEQEAAAYLKLTRRALQAWRYQGRGPRFVKISARAVRYRPEDLETWVETHLRTSTVDPGSA
jgi:predicted DNA-binding transcriptional regulator AlpA